VKNNEKKSHREGEYRRRGRWSEYKEEGKEEE